MPNTVKKLTVKQQRFVDFYDGNATDAARKAGYKGNANTLGQVGDENLKKPKIAEAIRNRESKKKNHHIATREERQQFWSKVLRGDLKTKKHIAIGRGGDREVIEVETEPEMKDRLKAAELLGRSECDFVEKHINYNREMAESMTREEIEAEIFKLRSD